VKVFVDERPVLDWWDLGETGDEVPLEGGCFGFQVCGGRLGISGFTVDRIRSWQMAPIARVKDLCLETDLGGAQIVIDMQAHWSKPMCDSSMHQWEATLEDKAIYALASGDDRFFTSGAAQKAAERALRTTNNVGHPPGGEMQPDAGQRLLRGGLDALGLPRAPTLLPHRR